MASTLDSTTDKLSKLGINGEFASSTPNLRKNLHLLSPEQVELAKMLLETGQSHLFEHWAEPGVDDDQKKGFFEQVALLNSSYPGGLESYIKNARRLLADSKAGKNPYDGFTPSVPTGETLTFADDNFIKFEETGVKEARRDLSLWQVALGSILDTMELRLLFLLKPLLEHAFYSITLNLYWLFKKPTINFHKVKARHRFLLLL